MIDVSLRHDFGGFKLDLDFRTGAGVTALFGRSGAGKTSIINAVAGLMHPQSGRIAIGDAVLFDSAKGIFLPPPRRRIGYVFQEGRLFPHMNVRRNLTYGARFAPKAAGPDFDEVVALLGIDHLLDRPPSALSGGEKQRVAIGRALLSRPHLLLMDEPLAALDEARKAELLPYLERLRRDSRVPILYVSHSVPEILRLAQDLVLVDQGRVVAAGPLADVMSSPESVKALGPRAIGAVISARIAAHEPGEVTRMTTPAGDILVPRLQGAPGETRQIRIAAQDVMIALERPQGLSALNILPAVIRDLQPDDAGGVLIGLQLGEVRALARVTQRSRMALGLQPGLGCHAVLKSVAVSLG
ncbi:molybdenum ABC transporter ATP-binding protein [Ketogulonicigenium vulgare]|uniref:Molybdate ABC transporter, ATPase subunit n=1 Tax=Ketogulonicigenium vulgare (strain WSH-001) TaxID=759362 RepID=F9Y4C1_KETVW|nr:molybdenum ABC transporter ATP-binding protein [Ketogulonicigenium vulgare]ADO43450.1 molybdate ABC transporter, ATP-binding protein [Ketogulonicigenium vulgare Y25]AEM41734.1 Molybdate ABC transporter, ATPase subunit [Ketogulonicigenium vulgare WSH-001]ALJ81841.1 molybdenum ABC transporter ATP-binding protein [Ketogulonicigenium vulgare]ANW34497.1 molybdenum ABC transporter ATP-binding protein [Ketogulonicigenium vulgare]AOZ55487.1 molybdate ABC transporter ATP-binding protein [Ketogulonic